MLCSTRFCLRVRDNTWCGLSIFVSHQIRELTGEYDASPSPLPLADFSAYRPPEGPKLPPRGGGGAVTR